MRQKGRSSVKIQKTKSMYSPKISEDLIPRIYRAAKEQEIPMTRWVNRAVERALPQIDRIQEVCLTVANDADGFHISCRLRQVSASFSS
jgi:hypothetical protein